MTDFYDGQRCVVTKRLGEVQWMYILDATLPANDRVREPLAKPYGMLVNMCLLAFHDAST